MSSLERGTTRCTHSHARKQTHTQSYQPLGRVVASKWQLKVVLFHLLLLLVVLLLLFFLRLGLGENVLHVRGQGSVYKLRPVRLRVLVPLRGTAGADDALQHVGVRGLRLHGLDAHARFLQVASQKGGKPCLFLDSDLPDVRTQSIA